MNEQQLIDGWQPVIVQTAKKFRIWSKLQRNVGINTQMWKDSFTSLSELIISGFSWGVSPEGYEYWDKKHRQVRKYELRKYEQEQLEQSVSCQ